MVRLLGNDAYLVSYGGMAKQPLSIPTSSFIFKNLTCLGFWQRRWYNTRSSEDRDAVMQQLVQLIQEKKVERPSLCELEHHLIIVGSLILPTMK